MIYAQNGNVTRVGAARIADIVGCGRRVLVAGSRGDGLLRALHANVCDVVLVAPNALPTDDALCDRVIRRALDSDRLLAELGPHTFEAIVLDGAAATPGGVADLAPVLERVLQADGILVGRGEAGNALRAALEASAITLLAEEGDLYLAARLPEAQRRAIEESVRRMRRAEELVDEGAREAELMIAKLTERAREAERAARELSEHARKTELATRELDRWRNRATVLEAELQAALAERAGEAERAARELSEHARKTEHATRELDRWRNRATGLTEEIQAVRTELHAVRAELATAQAALGAAEAELRAAVAERDAEAERAARFETRDREWRELLLDAHEQLLARDEELAAALSQPDDDGYLEYRAIVARVRELVRAHTPADVPVVVASNGDEELVDLDGRPAWHFPQADDGVFAGHHFADGLEAIAQLEALRANGAGFFVLPGSSWWWLEHYPELTAHLERHHETIAREEEVCLIVDLRSPKALAEDERGAAYEELVRDLRELVERSTPAHATLVVASKGDQKLLDLGGRTAWHVPEGESGVYAGYHPPTSVAAIAELESARERGAQYFVLPATQLWWLEHYDELARHLERNARVAGRAEAGVVYRLSRGVRLRRRR